MSSFPHHGGVKVMPKAAVLHEPGEGVKIEEMSLGGLEPNEVRIKVHGVGICHTDLSALEGVVPLPTPIVLGHEGAGEVVAVGSEVSDLVPGDHVVVSFDTCGECQYCEEGRPAYCEVFAALNYFGTRMDGTTTLCGCNGGELHGNWFGQSTFATEAIVSRRNAVKVDKSLPIEILGPLGCGFMTGAGTVLNVLKPKPGQSIAIFGMGSVGLAALMAARSAGCSTIIAVDLNDDRLALATELGATHVVNPSKTDDLVWDVMEIASPGLDFSIDCVGHGTVVRQALEVLRTPGTCATVGLAGLENEITIDQGHLLLGRNLMGVIEGDADPQVFIPKLLEMWQAGEFPFDRLIEKYPFTEIDAAITATKEGGVVKPVIIMN
jgi:aryl-alcohol dehydrogenase